MTLYCASDDCPTYQRSGRRLKVAEDARDGTDLVLQCRRCGSRRRYVVEGERVRVLLPLQPATVR